MITMKDIAEKAGVSRPTVSAVLNGKETTIRISEATKGRIVSIAAEMGYLPNENARAIKNGHTNIIGVIGKFHGSYATEMLRGIAKEIDLCGFSIKLVMPENLAELRRALQKCIEQRVCGVICYASDRESARILKSESDRYSLPVVLLDSDGEFEWCSRITSDDGEGAFQAVSYLLGEGHRNIVFATRLQHREYAYSLHREAGYRKAFEAAGLHPDSGSVMYLDSAGGADDLKTEPLLEKIRNNSVSAIFCASDTIAMLLIVTLSRAGLRVPGDVSIIGFGDLEYAAYSNPPLTTVAQPFLKMGAEAVKQLLKRISKAADRKKISLPTRLIVRESTCSFNKINKEKE